MIYSKVDLSGKSSAGTECNLVGGKEEGLAGLEPEFRTLPSHDTLHRCCFWQRLLIRIYHKRKQKARLGLPIRRVEWKRKALLAWSQNVNWTFPLQFTHFCINAMILIRGKTLNKRHQLNKTHFAWVLASDIVSHDLQFLCWNTKQTKLSVH